MAIILSINGNAAGDGFLIAPLDNNYEAELSLATDSGTASVTLQASPNPAGVVFSTTGPISISTVPTIVTLHATAQSASRGDTTIQVVEGGTVVASATITSIKHPVVNFNGRFEARFATDSARFNQNPMYTPTNEIVGPGWTWGLEGEPDFVPSVGNVPEDLTMTGMGRVVRYNSPVALRSHAQPVVSTVTSITGETTSGTQTFVTGDPLIGQPVNLGPDTYLAGNNSFGTPTPEEFWDAAKEPMGLFELHFGSMFSGSSQVGAFTHKSVAGNEHTRVPDSRPIADGTLSNANAELSVFALPNLTTFSDARIDQLVSDYTALPPGPSPQRRNLIRRIGHLLPRVPPAKSSSITAAHPEITSRAGTLAGGWPNKEVYKGKVDTSLSFSPSGSSMITYMSEFSVFNFESSMFAFHSDELCGYHIGKLTPDLNFHGSYTGDPHTHTVNGITYDFQSVGEFTLLRQGEGMEIQVRQTPVEAANPVTDAHTGLTACVSIITAVAARVGRHWLSLQPSHEGKLLQFYLDGKPAQLPVEGLDLDRNWVSGFDADGETGIRIDYHNNTVVIITPAYWNSYNVWYINVSVSQTSADEGIMGYIPSSSWLPRLRNGESVGSLPASLQDRYDVLYIKFANSWRIKDKNSLFTYAPGSSTKTFTDKDWPAEQAPCTIKPELLTPGMKILKGMPIAEAEKVCRIITIKDLHRNCVFDVATTGDPIFAKGYYLTQELRLYGTAVVIEGRKPALFGGREQPGTDKVHLQEAAPSLLVVATVVPLTSGRPTPTGNVVFTIDGIRRRRPVKLDAEGRVHITLQLKPGEHNIRAMYLGGEKYNYHSSSSANLHIKVPSTTNEKHPKEQL